MTWPHSVFVQLVFVFVGQTLAMEDESDPTNFAVLNANCLKTPTGGGVVE
jgi:hypothetical protein